MAEQTAYAQLATQARAGQVYISDEATAYQLYKACDQRISDLDGLLDISRQTQAVGGFGGFKMSEALQQQYLGQATGEDNSIDKVLLKDIESVKQLREVFALSFQRITGQDIANANALDYTTEQVV